MSIRKRPLSISIGQWQMVEIAKALARNAKIIAFDEPTSSLSAREIENLFRVIRELRKEGRIILYVSHRMEEIFACPSATCASPMFHEDDAQAREYALHERRHYSGALVD